MSTYDKIEGFVWCDEHGTIHDDSTDPYDMGQPDCRKADHRPVTVRRRKGDYSRR